MPPPATSDLIFSEQANFNFSKTLGELKRSTLSIQNRLQSIQQDAAFAQRVASAYGRPLIANERCGSWYIDPQNKSGSSYFKSTDGHTGVWKFSLRRLNFHLLEVIGKHDGCIVVDSTRRGKRMPDALSKTIPIWCSTINSLLFSNESQCHELYTPPQVVSLSEHSQITALLPNFLESIQALNLSVDSLKSQISKPLRPIWLTPDSPLIATESVFDDFHPIICCTVSHMVTGGEISEGGYIQGAGDDTENWAHGLSASLFWANYELLRSSSETQLRDLIEMLVLEAADVRPTEQCMKLVKPTKNLFITSISSVSTNVDLHRACTIVLLPKVTEEGTWQTSPTQLNVGLGHHKLGSRNLRSALPTIVAFADKIVRSLKNSNGLADNQIILACESGEDLSIGAALTLLCVFFDEEGNFLADGSGRAKIDKNFIRRRLGWISVSIPEGNPSRATLQSVNSFLMERP